MNNLSNWYRALTLGERLQLTSDRDDNINAELARKLVKHWRSQPPFTNDSYFAQRLTVDNINEQQLFNCLGEPIEVLQKRLPHPPDWLSELIEAFNSPDTSKPLTIPSKFKNQEIVGFLEVIKPLILHFINRCQNLVNELSLKYTDLPFDANTVVALLFGSLPENLLAMVNRTLVLELHVQRLQGLLHSETPQERFQNFLERMRQPDNALALLEEYPVLARQLVIYLDNWVTSSLEFLRRLCADWDAILTAFNSNSHPGLLVKISGDMGDNHRGGRTVIIPKFSSGFQVVYKPKSLAADLHFQELLTWLNYRGANPPLRSLTILERETYGWVEFVTPQSCTEIGEVERFYQRQGAYLALLYALEATDFHCENLIAMGEHPMLIDLEALFHPRVEGIDLRQASEVANTTINYSVLGVGLLPQRGFSNQDFEGVDFSGLGAMGGQLTPSAVPQWLGLGTDEMRLERKRIPMPVSDNHPKLNGLDVYLLEFTEAIVAGFTSMYSLLLKHRDELLSDESPLARFAEDEVRVIVRSTHTYAILLRESFHPDMLRDALERDRLFDKLWAAVEQCPYLPKVIPAERADLLQGDIPIFTTRPTSRNIWSSTKACISDFFDETGMSLVQRRLQQLSEKDCTQQLWFIRASLATLSNRSRLTHPSKYHLPSTQTTANREQLLAAACAVGDRLEALALRGEYDISWVGLQLNAKEQWSLLPLGTDLYDGLPGVVLFLAYLGAIAKNDCYTTLSKAALKTLQSQIQRSQNWITSIGGFDGWGGIIYTLTHLGRLWHEPMLLAQAENIVSLIPGLIQQDEVLDVIGGTAGCLASLISLYHCVPSQRTLEVAIQCGDRLIVATQNPQHGTAWRRWNAQGRILTGFSHGAAGIAWALLELAALTGEKRFHEAALPLITYEQSLFSPVVLNWEDLRDLARKNLPVEDNQPIFQMAWCHGAPGIGIARLRSLNYLDTPEIRREIDAALSTTLTNGFGDNHCLCHGDLGNLEFLLQASQILANPDLHSQVYNFAARLLESINQHQWICGTVFGIESPGLMTGLAGIGYQLLRLASPDCVPSILVLASK